MSKSVDKVVQQAITEVKSSKKKKIKRPRLLTGATLLDVILAGEKDIYGIPVGVIWNLIGLSGGGKTFICNELIARSKKRYKDKFKWFFDDAEGGNEVDTQLLYGFDTITDEMKENRSSTVEELHMNIKKFVANLKSDEIGCYVCDSLDALVSNEIKTIIDKREKAYEKGKEFDEGSYLMGKAKYLKQQFFPDIKPLIESSNCLLIITSQQSKKIGITFGSTDSRAGGDALRFFAHFESWIKVAEKLAGAYKGQKRTLGIRSKIKFTKTRNPRNFREAYITIMFDYGISTLDDDLDYVYDLVTDTGKTRTNFNVVYDGKEFKKKNKLIEYIEENGHEEKIKNATIMKWEEVEDAIKIKRKRRY